MGNNILFRGVVDGKRVKAKIPYQPTFYESSRIPTEFKTLDGEYLRSLKFDSMREARDYYKQFEDVSGKVIYGNNRFEYAYIADNHKGMIDWDIDQIQVGIVDIEVGIL
jgi:hypothetical protein